LFNNIWHFFETRFKRKQSCSFYGKILYFCYAFKNCYFEIWLLKIVFEAHPKFYLWYSIERQKGFSDEQLFSFWNDLWMKVIRTIDQSQFFCVLPPFCIEFLPAAKNYENFRISLLFDLFGLLVKCKRQERFLLLLGSLWLSNHWSFKVNLLIRKIT
jgi:hypothetical protein